MIRANVITALAVVCVLLFTAKYGRHGVAYYQQCRPLPKTLKAGITRLYQTPPGYTLFVCPNDVYQLRRITNGNQT